MFSWSWGLRPSGRSGRSPTCLGGLPMKGIRRGRGGRGMPCRLHWLLLGPSGPAERFHGGVRG